MENQTITIDEGLTKIVSDAISGMNRSSDTTAKLGETVVEQFNKLHKMWEVKFPEVVPGTEVAKSATKAALGESLTTTFKDVTKEIVPLALGGSVSIVFTEVVDGVFINQNHWVRGGIKAGGAILVWKFGKKIPFVGQTGANIAAILIGFDAIRTLIPQYQVTLSTAANSVTKRIPIGGLGDQHPRGQGAMAQANQILRMSTAQKMSGR